MTPAVAHHADIPEEEVERGDIAFRRRRLGRAAGSVRIGASHYLVPPNARQMPVHVHGDEEEIFFVLAGSGLGYELQGQDPTSPAVTYPVAAGDTVVHRPQRAPHTFLAGGDGLELIAFGSGSETSITYLPRAGVMWCGPRWVPVDAPHPFAAEAAAGPLRPPAPDPAAGPLRLPAPDPTPGPLRPPAPDPAPGPLRPPAPDPAAARRPSNVVALADLETGRFPPAEIRKLGMAAGSVKAGLNHVVLPPGGTGAPPHCHTLEEELFVVLEGGGTLTLGDETHPLAAGDVVARPPSRRQAHALTAGAEGLTYLVYGTREPGDAVFYPDTGKVWIQGLDVWLQTGTR